MSGWAEPSVVSERGMVQPHSLPHGGAMCCADTCTIEAGYDEGTQRTLGSPVMIRVPNKDQKSKDYAQVGC